MFPLRTYENKRKRAGKEPKIITRMCKANKCRDCSVVVTRMDFAKILGKFTKVKIQYENKSTKDKSNATMTSPNSTARLKSNENGMVLIHRNAYKEHPAKDLLSGKRPNNSTNFSNKSISPPQLTSNILKENNRLRKTPLDKDKNANYNRALQRKNFCIKYGIFFNSPETDFSFDDNVVRLSELLPSIDKSVLPTPEWSIDYFPKDEEPKADHVYDRIAAELEDLMYNDKETPISTSKDVSQEPKTDDFPSIMDILNENTNEKSASDISNQQIVPSGKTSKTNLESSDVEAMLLGDSSTSKIEPTPMDVDQLIVGVQLTPEKTCPKTIDTDGKISMQLDEPMMDERCNSPSILDEALSKGLEEHLPKEIDSLVSDTDKNDNIHNKSIDGINGNETTNSDLKIVQSEKEIVQSAPKSEPTEHTETSTKEAIIYNQPVTHIVFKQINNGDCLRSVMCCKNLQYKIELEGKPVQLLGAPQFITCLDDLQVLLQIVNESGLNSFYVLH